MLRANRPWRLVGHLYAMLIAALAVGAYGVVTSDIWRLSTTLSWWRLTITSAASIAITVATVIVVPGLWERTSDPRVRGQVVLFNLATAITVTLGIVSLYAVLFLLILACAGLVTAPHAFAQAIGRPAGFADYATLAWFVASLSTVGGALGSALESEDAVRAAAYSSAAGEGADATEHKDRD
jgi:predicted Kef-type K+ transport protein